MKKRKVEHEACHDEHCHGEHCHDEHCHDEHCHGEHCHDDCCHDEGCGCGHDHGSEKEFSLKKTLALYILGALPIICAFISPIPLPIRIILASVGYLIFGFSVWKGMISGFRKKKIFTEFTLMCVASVGAFAIGEYADGAAVMYLYSLGEMLSDRAYARSKKNISSLLEITPEYATVMRGGEGSRVDPCDVVEGEILLVVAGERVPIDGVVIEGGADADTSSVTGESTPLALYDGVFCPSGSVLSNGAVKLRTVANYENSVVSRLAKAVKEASGRKAETEKKRGNFARVFTPIAFGVALLTFIIGAAVTRDVITWLRAALVILVVSCPCSLVLSVPLTYFAGIGAAASKGIVFKGGAVMDSVKRLKGIAFDKTGTLTRSELELVGVQTFTDLDVEGIKVLASQVLPYSPHAAARSFCRIYPPMGEKLVIESVENIGGRGLICFVDGKKALFGNGTLMRESGIDAPDSAETAIYVALDNVLVGKLNFSAELKNGVIDSVAELGVLGVDRVALISGDGEVAVEKIAKKARINEYYHSVPPHEKARIYEDFSNRVKSEFKNGSVAYCGDGLNDSAVIAMADVGIAMGECGAALTVDSADVILMDDDPVSICEAIKISRRTSAIATQNIIISLGIKIAVLIAGLIVSSLGGQIPMEIAIVADVGACIVAVMNALRASKRSKK